MSKLLITFLGWVGNGNSADDYYWWLTDVINRYMHAVGRWWPRTLSHLLMSLDGRRGGNLSWKNPFEVVFTTVICCLRFYV